MKMVCSLALLLSMMCPGAFAQDALNDDKVLVTGGTFSMGTAPANIPALKERYGVDFPEVFENEAPRHEVTVSDFWIDSYEVTYARFAEFLAANRAWRPDKLRDREHNGDYLADWRDGRYPEEKAAHPVVFITWSSAEAFCRWNGGRLPTEAEWEFAARSGDSREFPWGDSLPDPDLANYGATGNGETVRVGAYAPNELEIFDLAGNVWEFLSDEWAPKYPEGAQIDPVAGGFVADEKIRDVTGRRAVRGASFGGSIVNLRTRWRDSHIVTNAIEFVGFRCAYPAD